MSRCRVGMQEVATAMCISLNQSISLLLAVVELAGLDSLLSPGLGALCREVKQHRYRHGRTPWQGEGQDA